MTGFLKLKKIPHILTSVNVNSRVFTNCMNNTDILLSLKSQKWRISCSRDDFQLAYWYRINANGGAPNDSFSWKKKNDSHIMIQIMNHLYNDMWWMNSNLLTLLTADPPASCPKWVPLCLFSCLPHLCWVPTDSSLYNWAGPALHLLPRGWQSYSKK
jgi:hypothetical protein